MRTGKVVALFGVLAGAVVNRGCIGDFRSQRVFPDEASTVRHFRRHEADFTQLALKFLSTRNLGVCVFGGDHIRWNNYYIDRSLSGWSVRYPTSDDWIERSSKSLDEAAREAETTAAELHKWQHLMTALEVQCLDATRITYRGISGRYLQVAMSPPIPGYGLRFAPQSDPTASEALAQWASRRSTETKKMRAISPRWFYYEGLQPSSHPPLSELSGRVLFANEQPAAGIRVHLERAFGFGPNPTTTDEAGAFRVVWVTQGRYRVVANVFDPSIRDYRTWYFPGVSDPEAASEVAIGEDETASVGAWKISMAPPVSDPKAGNPGQR